MYYPILKSKEGEFLALAQVPEEMKLQMCPVIEILSGTDNNTVAKLSEHWNHDGNQLLIDASYYEEDEDFGSLIETFEKLHENDVNASPVIDLEDPEEYLEAVESIIE